MCVGIQVHVCRETQARSVTKGARMSKDKVLSLRVNTHLMWDGGLPTKDPDAPMVNSSENSKPRAFSGSSRFH